MSEKYWVALGAVLAGAAVTLGAIGTHFLKQTLKWPEGELETFEVAVRYQMYHALGMILVGLLMARNPSRLLRAAAIAFLVGIVLFSGGLYLWLATNSKLFVTVVPMGGLIWIVGWLLLAWGACSPSARRDA